MNQDCIFCRIIAGEIPGTKIYENESVLAILDINPVNPGHILVLPKTHASNLEDISEVELTELIKVVKILGSAIKKGLNYPGYNVIVNNDPVAGQIIAHLHFHIIPRLENDGLKQWPQKQYESQGQVAEIAEKIKSAI